MFSADGTESITQVGLARQKLFSSALDRVQAKNTIGNATEVNKEGYMTDLQSVCVQSQTEINDLKKARALLKAIVQTNPQSTSGWIAAARVEELDGKLKEARNILEQACAKFPHAEDVWLEAVRLSAPQNVKGLLGRAVKNLPKSEKLWLQASQHEESSELKIKVLRRGLEQLPRSVNLWKECVSL